MEWSEFFTNIEHDIKKNEQDRQDSIRKEREAIQKAIAEGRAKRYARVRVPYIEYPENVSALKERGFEVAYYRSQNECCIEFPKWMSDY
jgi:hypothetical protein